jgi:hypothetical protein
MSIYKNWKLICGKCAAERQILSFDDMLPSACNCTGKYLFADTKERVKMSKEEQMLADLEEFNVEVQVRG